MIKNYVLFLVLILFNLNTIAQTPISTATTDVVTFVATESDGSTFTTGRPLNESATFTTNTQWNQTIYNNGATNSNGRITVKKQYSRHQKNDLFFTASNGGIITIKMKFTLIGESLAAGNNLCYLGLVDYLDATNTGDPTNSPEEGEYIVLSIDDGETTDALSGVGYGNRHLFMRYKTNGQTQELADDAIGYLTIKYFIGSDMDDSVIKTRLEYGDADSGWRNHGWTSQRLYDTLTQTGTPTNTNGAYMIFSGREALTSSNAATSHMYINQYDFTYNDSGVVMITNNAINYNSTSSTGAAPASSDRVYIFDKNVTFGGSGNKTYDYLFIDEQGSFSFTPSSAKSLTITNDIELGGDLTLGTVDDFSATNFDIENGATFDITEADALSVTNFNIKTGGTATINSATSLTTTDLDVGGGLSLTTTGDVTVSDLDMSGDFSIAGNSTSDVTLTNADVESGATLTISNANDIASTDTAIKGNLIIGTANDLTFTDLDVDGTVSVSTANKIDLDHLDFGTGATFDLTDNSLREGFVVVSPNASGTPETNEFDSNFTLNGVSSLLTAAPGGLLLRKTSYLNRYYAPVDVDPTNTDSGSYWERYDTTTEDWVDEADFPSNTTVGYYQNSNLIYNSQAYGTGSLSGDGDEHFQFNDIHILDGKKMILNNLIVTANNVYIEDTSDASSIVIYSGALKTTGSISGNLQYNKYLDTERWYAVSSPVVGQDIDALISSEDLLTGSGTNVALATYENDGTQYTTDPNITTGWWNYFQSGQTNSGSFNGGKGYITQLENAASDQQLTFTGTVNNGSVSIPITTNTTAFNLVGNPYTASIAINSVADATNNVLTVNSAELDEQTAWFWNGNSSEGATPGYVTINQNPSQNPKISMPTQAFFVKSAAGGGNFSFTTAMQTSSQGSFNRQTEFSKIDLSMSADGQTSATEIVYFEGATTGWDNGYDSTNFSSAAFQLFTDHVDNAWNDNLSIQSLPPNNYDNMVVPVGVNASAGQSIAISIGTTNWPEGVNVYLEDTDDNSFTLLDANTAFTTLLDSDENGIGRFYIHTTSNSLGDGDLTLTDVVIYTPSKDILRILGLSSGPANVQMFDLMGKQVLNTSFNGQSVNDVKLPNLNTGVYLVTLVSDEGTVNKKLIIQ